MPDPDQPAAADAAMRRRNIRLGLVVGGVCAAMTLAFIFAFTRHGLPRDPVVWKRMQSHEQGTQP